MKPLWVFLIFSAVALAQTAPDVPTQQTTLADLGLTYPLSSDWILATTMMQKQFSARNPASRDSVLLAAVYVPENAKFSGSSPFFSILDLPNRDPDCRKVLGATVLQLEKQDKVRVDRVDEQLSAAGRQFYRTDFEKKGTLRHRALICTTENNHTLLWNIAARDEQGVKAVVMTLDSITSVTPHKMADETPAKNPSTEPPSRSAPLRVRVSSNVSSGLILKKVPPHYPDDAREAHLQGTVILKAEISTNGDLVNLEVIEGPIEFLESTVSAVRQWKYRPYLLNGVAVTVETQIQVNYTLSY